MTKVDYRKILSAYRLDDPVLKQYFEKVSFEDAEYDRISQDYINDCSLALGMEYVLRKRLEEGTFIIVNAGAPHLPLIACLLKMRGSVPHFHIKGSAPSCSVSFLYFSEKYSAIEKTDGLPSMLFDAHAVFNKKKALPTVAKLKGLGVERSLILVEYNRKPLNNSYAEHPEFDDVVKEYEKKGIETEIVEIDPRPREKDFERIIEMMNEDEDFLKEFSSLLKSSPEKCMEIMKKGLKEFFD